MHSWWFFTLECVTFVTLVTLALMLSIFLGKCLCFQEKLRTRNSAKYRPPGNLIEAIVNVAVERGSHGGQSDGDCIGSYPVLPTNNTRIGAKCCDITTSEQQVAQQRSDKAASNVSVTNSAVMSINLSMFFRIRNFFSQILHAFCIHVQ